MQPKLAVYVPAGHTNGSCIDVWPERFSAPAPAQVVAIVPPPPAIQATSQSNTGNLLKLDMTVGAHA